MEPHDEVVRSDDGQSMTAGENLREVGQVPGHEKVGTGSYGCGEDVPVVRVR